MAAILRCAQDRFCDRRPGNGEHSSGYGFDGYYVTGDVTADYLSHLARERHEERGEGDADLAFESRVAAG